MEHLKALIEEIRTFLAEKYPDHYVEKIEVHVVASYSPTKDSLEGDALLGITVKSHPEIVNTYLDASCKAVIVRPPDYECWTLEIRYVRDRLRVTRLIPGIRSEVRYGVL